RGPARPARRQPRRRPGQRPQPGPDPPSLPPGRRHLRRPDRLRRRDRPQALAAGPGAAAGAAPLAERLRPCPRPGPEYRSSMRTRAAKHGPAAADLPLVGLEDIEEARRRVAGVVRRTPVDHSETITRLAGRPILLKPE